MFLSGAKVRVSHARQRLPSDRNLSASPRTRRSISRRRRQRLKVDLTTCEMTDTSIEIVKTSGRFGDIVKGLETEISGALR
ncbi:hypothetical protein ELH51_05710 [Rhizobium ruizarguesonis]|nr:hypothetical protein ELH51_05710 [Rhizobium ruizarguesonis]